MGVWKKNAQAKGDDAANQPLRSVWQSILTEGAQADEERLSCLLVLGRAGAGKKSLVRSLQRTANGSLAVTEPLMGYEGVGGSGYAYVNVCNLDEPDSTELSSKMNVWILESSCFKSMLRNRITPQETTRMAVVICLDMRDPTSLLEDFRLWMDVVESDLVPIINELPLDCQDAMRKKITELLESYKGKKASTEEETPSLPKITEEEEDHVRGETTAVVEDGIVFNVGVPIIVAVCQPEGVCAEKKGQQDVILAHLRASAISYGASLIYTTSRDLRPSTSVDTLYRFLTVLLHDYNGKADLPISTNFDDVFLPMGFDNRIKLAILAEQIGGLETVFSSRNRWKRELDVTKCFWPRIEKR